MENPATIRILVSQRLAEASTLLHNNHLEGALYLVGYCVELELKARLCERFEVPNLFSKNEQEDQQRPGIGECRKAVLTHSLRTLLIFCGLFNKVARVRVADPNIGTAFSLVLEKWTEKLRYEQYSPLNSQEITKVIQSLDGPNGILQWIRNN